MLLVAGPAVGTVVAMSGGFSGHSGVLVITSNFVWMCIVFTFLIGTNVIRLRAGSRWEERTIRVYGDIPEPIARVARLLYNELSGSRLILGELKQQEVVLDPYLLIEHNANLFAWVSGRVMRSSPARGDHLSIWAQSIPRPCGNPNESLAKA
jgi:hypothetical protein